MNNIVSQAWPEWNGTLRKRSGGWNNTTYFIDKDSRRAVLRIYDTHRDRNKIEFEHAVLQKLAILDLPFKTPVPILTSTGETMVQLEEGEESSLACSAISMVNLPLNRIWASMSRSVRRPEHYLLCSLM